MIFPNLKCLALYRVEISGSGMLPHNGESNEKNVEDEIEFLFV